MSTTLGLVGNTKSALNISQQETDTSSTNQRNYVWSREQLLSKWAIWMQIESIWITIYFVTNLALTVYNKWVLQKLHFNFPWLLTAVHISISGIGSYMLCQASPIASLNKKLKFEDWCKLLGFSLLYAINIALSNVSLAHVSLAFHQVVRSSTPAITVLLEYVLFNKKQNILVMISLIPVMFGILLATVQGFYSLEFGMVGFILTFTGVLLSAAKGIVTNVLMVGSLKLHPLEVIWRMALPSVVQCIIYSIAFGEAQQLPKYFQQVYQSGQFITVLAKLFFNGFLAFALNWASFTANQKTSALSMTVAANVKQALSIVLGVYIFQSSINWLNSIGIVMTIIGGAWYSALSLQKTCIMSNIGNRAQCKLASFHLSLFVDSPRNPKTNQSQ